MNLFLMPPSPDHFSTQVVEVVSGECGWARLLPVLDLPGLLVHVMGASQTEVHLGVVTELHHAIGAIGDIAAPALDAAVVVRVDGSHRGFPAHRSIVRAESPPGKPLSREDQLPRVVTDSRRKDPRA